MTTEYLWHGRRYWVTRPVGPQHIGWNTQFEQCEVIKKTATRVHILSPSCGKMQLNRLKLERAGKVYHSRVHEYFYATRPAVDPEKLAHPFRATSAHPAFAELNLRPGCSQADIKRAYRQLARVHHPDMGGSAQAFARLQAAYTQALALTQ